jgi:dTDP-D-glucose 4,6-dehydratase
MQNIMVTGGAGFIGSNFVRYMLDKYSDYRILVYDKLTYAGNLDNQLDVDDDSRYAFVQADICDAAAVAVNRTAGVPLGECEQAPTYPHHQRAAQSTHA